MRKMKSILCVLLAAMLILSLAACVKQPDGTVGASTPATTAPAPTGDSVSTPAATAPVGTEEPAKVKIDMNDGWTIGIKNGGPFSEVGYYYIDDSFLYFMDTKNGISVILCSKAGCRHNNSKDWDEIFACEAYIYGCTIMFYSDGYLYFDKHERDNPNAIHLYRRNADGTAEKKIATLCEAFFSKTSYAEITGYLCADGILYYAAMIYDVEEESPNNFVDTRSEVLLMRLDLKTRKEKEILRLKNAYIMPLAARKDALIFHRLEVLPQNKMKDYEKRDSMPSLLQVWTENNGTTTTIFEKTHEQCNMIGIYGDKFYYYGRNEHIGVYAYDFVTDEHITTDLPDRPWMVNDDYWYVHGELNTTIYDFRTGKPVSGDFVDWQISFRKVGELGAICRFRLHSGKTPEGKLIIEREFYGYVLFAAMEDGLQKEDVLIIYEKER